MDQTGSDGTGIPQVALRRCAGKPTARGARAAPTEKQCATVAAWEIIAYHGPHNWQPDRALMVGSVSTRCPNLQAMDGVRKGLAESQG